MSDTHANAFRIEADQKRSVAAGLITEAEFLEAKANELEPVVVPEAPEVPKAEPAPVAEPAPEVPKEVKVEVQTPDPAPAPAPGDVVEPAKEKK